MAASNGGTRFMVIALVSAITVAGCGTVAAPSVAPSLAVAATAAPTPQATIGAPTATPIPSSAPSPTSSSSDGVQTVLVDLQGVGSIATSDSELWITLNSGDVDAVDVATKQVHPVTVNGSALDGINVGDHAVWVADFGAGQLIKIDPMTYQVVDRIAVPDAEDALEVNGTVWVTNHEEGSVTLVDAVADKVIKTLAVGDPGRDGPQRIAFGLGSIWVDESNTNNVIRLDPTSHSVIAKIAVPDVHPCGDIATTPHAVWVTGCFDTSAVARIDPKTNSTVATTMLDSAGETPVVIDDSVWLPITDQIVHLDPTTGQIDKHVDVPEIGAGGPSVVLGDTLYVSDFVATVKAIPTSLLTAPTP
jgi:YVTN family beta-propeller protein